VPVSDDVPGWRAHSRQLRLNCTDCGTFTEYEVVDPEAEYTTLECAECGYRANILAVHMVDPDHEYPRNDAGYLLEDPL